MSCSVALFITKKVCLYIPNYQFNSRLEKVLLRLVSKHNIYSSKDEKAQHHFKTSIYVENRERKTRKMPRIVYKNCAQTKWGKEQKKDRYVDTYSTHV